MSEEETKRTFQLQRIYARDISFEVPGAPDIFRKQINPHVNVQLNSEARRISEDNDQYEVVLTLTITASEEETTVYLVEVKQAGIFSITGIEGEELERLLGSHCPQTLFPYARETVSDLVNRGSFPQLLLQPMNFEALFQEARRRRAEKQQEGAEQGSGGAH